MNTPTGQRSSTLRTVDLVRRYGVGETAVTAVAGVSLGFEPAQFTAIMGPSGSGKSTLMNLLAGLDTPTSGSVLVEGQDLARLDDRGLTRLRRERIGFVFQAFNLLPALTAEQNILLPLRLAGQRPDRDRLDEVVRSLRLGDRLGHRPTELSGGQQQRVALARALLTRPAVLLADEPTGALDVTNGRELLERLRTASSELGRTIVMVTHDPVAATYADRVLLMSDGALHGTLEHPTAEQVLAAVARAESRC
ncbi:ABC transporter ATP-binding protein [Nocardiopsis terrae]|uniref:ABC transport system ATP-binding protein n=1 Tax=Nocardiopsis terrae TaxID=372655 RepID=A0ABR9HKH5_9ACTN|nr:ABC transporter ATP-binding protein [Nocardiopsis terrae]MBE1459516.1 putative ABC transport system ATP-binding protein [Nocardiopsis terrae]GHC95245.1 ABC transporter ATP-binding protein [Nocardiopsis terrae]